MTHEENLLFEQRFPSQNMTDDERNFYLALLGQIKEISNPNKKYIYKGEVMPFEMVTMSLNQKGNNVYFNGALYSKNENRWIDGNIKAIDEDYYLITTVIQRLHESLEDDEKIFKTSDLLSFTRGNIRSTDYEDLENFEETIDMSTSYVNEHTNMLLRRIK